MRHLSVLLALCFSVCCYANDQVIMTLNISDGYHQVYAGKLVTIEESDGKLGGAIDQDYGPLPWLQCEASKLVHFDGYVNGEKQPIYSRDEVSFDSPSAYMSDYHRIKVIVIPIHINDDVSIKCNYYANSNSNSNSKHRGGKI